MTGRGAGAPGSCDCLIAGGGPAGGALAVLLARAGRSVVLADAGTHRHAIPAETLVGAAARAIERCGLEVLFRGWPGASRHGVLWGVDDAVWRSNDDRTRGFLIARREFDAALRALAARCGAVVLERHAVTGPLPAIGRGSVRVQPAGGAPFEIEARTIVLAVGRHARQALVESREAACGPDTVALSLLGRGEPAHGDATFLEAVGAGWLWWIPLRDGRACVTLFADAGELRARGRDALIEEALGSARGPARGLADRRVGHAARATARLVRAGTAVFAVGDAASIVDPLSSQGVEKALASAESAALAIALALERAELLPRLVAHHATWERGLWRGHARRAAELYARERRFAARAFWRARHAMPLPATPDHVAPHPDLVARAGFERAGDRLVEVGGFALLDSDEVVTRAGPVPLAPLLAAIGAGAGIDELVARAARQPLLYLLSRRAIVDAVAWLHDAGYLVDGAVRR